jgi:hypothetical protein
MLLRLLLLLWFRVWWHWLMQDAKMNSALLPLLLAQCILRHN